MPIYDRLTLIGSLDRGHMNLEPMAEPPSGNDGHIYLGTDHKLYIHNGTEWVDIGAAVDDASIAEIIDTTGSDSRTAVTNLLPFWNVAWSGATAYEDGTAYASMTNSSEEIQAAITTAKTLGVPVVARGTYRVDSTISLTDVDVDFSASTFVCSSTSIAPVIRVGPTSGGSGGVTKHRTVLIPKINNAAYTSGSGWSGNSSIGIEIANSYSNSIRIPYVNGFETGVQLKGYGTGCVHNRIELGELRSNKINVRLTADATGWCNSNHFYKGNFQQSTLEPTTSGSRHILIEATTDIINNNVFDSPALEGDVTEYDFECRGEYNAILFGRWESTTPSAYFDGAGVRGNAIIYGTGVQNIAITYANGAGRTAVWAMGLASRLEAAGTTGTMILQNTSSGGPALQVLYNTATPSTDPATAYTVSVTPDNSYYKRDTDTQARIRFAHRTPEIHLGSGTATPDIVLSRGAADRLTLADGDYFRVGSVAALPTASSDYRGYTIRVEGGAGVADGLYICEKDAADAYNWKQVTTA